MAKKSKDMNPFTGRWRIISMSAWDEDEINEEEEGFICGIMPRTTGVLSVEQYRDDHGA